MEKICSPNWPSAYKFKDNVEQFIQDRIQDGSIIEVSEADTSEISFSPISAFKKKRSEKIQVVHDLSFPPNKSINSHIPPENCSVKYTTVLDAVKICQKLQNPWLAKTDLKNAYYHFPIRSQDSKFLGFKWEKEGKERSYVWRSAPYGLRSAAALFSEAGSALRYIYVKNGASKNSIFYLDDILVIDTSKESCQESLNIVLETCSRAGFEVQDKKTQGPTKILTFLGIEIDTILKQIKIDEERLVEMRNLLQEWETKITATKREILSILGKLNFCSQVVGPGRSFMARLIEDSKKGKYLHSKINISRSARSDIKWWSKSMKQFNGVTWFPREIEMSSAILIFSDASDIALAGNCKLAWTIVPFTGEYKWLAEKSIQYRELYAAVLTVATFSNELRNCQTVMHIDNEAMQKAIQRKSSKVPELMSLIRTLFFITTIHNIQYKAVHISSGLNRDSDNLSRLRLDQYFLDNPNANKIMSRPAKFTIDW